MATIIDYTALGDHYVSDYIYNNKQLIPIVDVVKVTKDVVFRLDIIINKYCGNNFQYLPILMDFNNISNPFNVKQGMYLNIPDFDFIIRNLSFNSVDKDVIPGIKNDMKPINKNKEKVNTSDNISNSGTTTAIPKLNINMRKVIYDKSTGIIKY